MRLESALAQYPREQLTRSPTPLDYLHNLSQDLGFDLWLKRDDLTDLALGGDKPRKLEYELAQAKLKEADVIVTCGSAQSNHARLTTAAARKLGLDCTVVLSSDGNTELTGNLLATRLMGADVRLLATQDHWALAEDVERIARELQAQGRRPHIIPVSGTTPHSCLGYVRAGLELAKQFKEADIEPTALYLPFGTGGIFSALLLSLRQQGLDTPIIGISVNQSEGVCGEKLEHWWQSLCQLLDQDPQQPKGRFHISDGFIGKGYGDAPPACLAAISEMASKEGILLDPVYSGKVFSALLAHKGRYQPQDKLVMLHSGGVPALFAYQDILQNIC